MRPEEIETLLAALHHQKALLDRVIALLEVYDTPGVPFPRRDPRGRKNMPAAERAEVSARMKAYWERRRAE